MIPTGARAAEQATHWRSDYLVHFRRLVEAGLASPDAAVTVAEDGLRSLHERMRVLDQGQEHALGEWPDTGRRLDESSRSRARAIPSSELVLPYRGDRLRGNEIRRRVNTWVEAGVVEPTIADVVEEVLANPDWLRLEGHTVAVLGAGAEMGPLPSLMRWGARVAAVDLDRAPIWQRVLGLARDGAGTLVVPVAADADILVARGGRGGRPARRGAERPALARGAARHASSSATTSTRTAPPTRGSRWRSTS